MMTQYKEVSGLILTGTPLITSGAWQLSDFTFLLLDAPLWSHPSPPRRGRLDRSFKIRIRN